MIHIRILWIAIGMIACGPRTLDVSVSNSGNDVEKHTDDDNTHETEDPDTDQNDTSMNTDEDDSATEQPDDNENQNVNSVADFSLTDMNSGSPRYGQDISPRDYIQQTTGWYFIKAT